MFPLEVFYYNLKNNGEIKGILHLTVPGDLAGPEHWLIPVGRRYRLHPQPLHMMLGARPPDKQVSDFL